MRRLGGTVLALMASMLIASCGSEGRSPAEVAQDYVDCPPGEVAVGDAVVAFCTTEEAGRIFYGDP